ncbi:hypothetical protein CEXT_214681 [Caerostris extrusa]|uniref:Uncharacterized protein n=1 Tax=Caerostris extrusa TaxID=172846 RepID=A0AAV4PJF0_CAEEX|nr:hypothetical protein CEXT_214681 [Caerostris extrusa]
MAKTGGGPESKESPSRSASKDSPFSPGKGRPPVARLVLSRWQMGGRHAGKRAADGIDPPPAPDVFSITPPHSSQSPTTFSGNRRPRKRVILTMVIANVLRLYPAFAVDGAAVNALLEQN